MRVGCALCAGKRCKAGVFASKHGSAFVGAAIFFFFRCLESDVALTVVGKSRPFRTSSEQDGFIAMVSSFVVDIAFDSKPTNPLKYGIVVRASIWTIWSMLTGLSKRAAHAESSWSRPFIFFQWSTNYQKNHVSAFGSAHDRLNHVGKQTVRGRPRADFLDGTVCLFRNFTCTCLKNMSATWLHT